MTGTLEMSSKSKIYWVANSPGPNQVDFFNRLSMQATIDLKVFYLAKNNAKWYTTDGINILHKHTFLYNLNPRSLTHQYFHCNPRILSLVLHGDYDLFVVSGYTYVSTLLAMILLAIRRKRFIFWGEMINRSGSLLSRLTGLALIWPLLRRAAGIFTMGIEGIKSFERIGIDPSRIFHIPYSCDLARYSLVKREYGLSRTKTIVTMSRLIEIKRVDLAIQTFIALADKYEDWNFTICGEGYLRGSLQKMVPKRYQARVKFVGFVSKEMQPEVYATSDIFLITSRGDGWGMVVPEAMASGLPIVSSRYVQSARDLLEDGACGYLIDIDNAMDLVNRLDLLMSSSDMRTRMGLNARRRALKYDAMNIASCCADILFRLT